MKANDSAAFLPGAARVGDLTGFTHEIEIRALPAEIWSGLRSLSVECRLPISCIFAGAWAILLSRYSGETDVVFGLGGLDSAGTFSIRGKVLDVSEDRSLLAWLTQVRQTLYGADTSEALPFDTCLVFDVPHASISLPLVLRITTSGVPCISAHYDGAKFSEGAVPRVLRHFQTILENLPAHGNKPISALPIMQETDLRELIAGRNQTQAEYRENACIHKWFEEQVARTPEREAVVFHGQQLSYRELNEKANRLAARLIELGAGPDTIVGISVERSLEMIVGLLGILKSGAAYLPLDPSFPQERTAFMLEDFGARILVAEEHLTERFSDANVQPVAVRSIWDGPAIKAPQASVQGRHLAYVIYTSGSTGRPKGVMVEHRQVSNFIAAMDQVLGTEAGVWLAVTSISFDISVLELFWTLARGFTIVLQTESEKLGSGGEYSIAGQIRNRKVTHLQCTPSMARFLAASEPSLAALGNLKKLMLGGEALPSALVTQLRKVVTGEIFNLYGPTETTVWSTAYRIVRDEAVIPIGRPIANTQVYVLDGRLRPIPFGVPGELFIGGAGVTRGYLGPPDLTAAKFLPDPFRPGSSDRVYRTGDLVRYRPDGELEFLGRIDNQVKILGFRIEPEEIENAISQHPGVRVAAIVVREDVPGEKKLVAYIVPGDRSVNPAELRAYAQQRLPAHMVPSGFVIQESLPQTPNLKIDRKSLAAQPLPASMQASVANGSLEETIAGIFQEALNLKTVNTQDNFFDLGANSIVMAQVAIALQETLQRNIPLTDLFQYPSVQSLAAHLDRAPGAAEPRSRVTERAQSRRNALSDRSRNLSPRARTLR